jgi:hypothetical protein
MDFIIHAASLRAFNYGIKPVRGDYRQIIADTNIPIFEPKSGVKILVEENEESSLTDDTLLGNAAEMLEQLPSASSLPEFFPADFEKDDDSNGHIGMSFIKAANPQISLLRQVIYEQQTTE